MKMEQTVNKLVPIGHTFGIFSLSAFLLVTHSEYLLCWQVLVKGSRNMKMERTVDKLVEKINQGWSMRMIYKDGIMQCIQDIPRE